MKPKPLKSIILPNADWTVRESKPDPEIIKQIQEASEEAERRKYVDPESLKLVINPYR
jgi:hypothetical protein